MVSYESPARMMTKPPDPGMSAQDSVYGIEMVASTARDWIQLSPPCILQPQATRGSRQMKRTGLEFAGERKLSHIDRYLCSLSDDQIPKWFMSALDWDTTLTAHDNLPSLDSNSASSPRVVKPRSVGG
ncbi:hypothetical protein V491_04269 [Pseudogymnoascus sp. VKM F-3775]|nr:hypothetical protein V491_04269 [Pseudogymnoascus sp. VKM F-3775]